MPTPLTIAQPTQILVTDIAASLLATAATGGAPGYTYQWHRSNLPGFVPSAATLLTGQTTLSIIDGTCAQNSIYYYIIQVTDSASTVVNSPQLGICTQVTGKTAWMNPSVQDFKTFYDRDFPFGTDMNIAIRDQDILKAMQQANTEINQILYLSQASYSNGFLWLTAHYLCTNINTSSQGINGQYNWGEVSKGAGGISQSFTIPEQILKNPYLFALTKTNYGTSYVVDLFPRLTGAMGSAFGNTKP